MLKPGELEAIKERATAAEPGPWEMTAEEPDDIRICRIGEWTDPDTGETLQDRCIGCLILNGEWDEIRQDWSPGTLERHRNNAIFVAHARDDVPKLVEEVRRLDGDNERLYKVIMSALSELTLFREGMIEWHEVNIEELLGDALREGTTRGAT